MESGGWKWGDDILSRARYARPSALVEGWPCLRVNVQLFIQRSRPKVLWITRWHSLKQGRRIGVESRVLSLINKARGLKLPLFPLLAHVSWKLLPPYCFYSPSLSFSSSLCPRSPAFVCPFIFELLVHCAKAAIGYLSPS